MRCRFRRSHHSRDAVGSLVRSLKNGRQLDLRAIVVGKWRKRTAFAGLYEVQTDVHGQRVGEGQAQR